MGGILTVWCKNVAKHHSVTTVNKKFAQFLKKKKHQSGGDCPETFNIFITFMTLNC